MKRPSKSVVVIGGSAGGVEALMAILPALPADFARPVVVVLHLPADRPSGITELFALRCKIPVREAEDKDALSPGCIYFAPPNYHLLVETEYSLALSVDPPVQFSRPSIDVFFESAADALGPGVIAILLSGSNRDGAQGLAKIQSGGGTVIVQNPTSATSPQMPEAGLDACPHALCRNPEDIPAILSKLCCD